MTKYMRSYIRQAFTGLLILSSLFFLIGCTSWKSPLMQADYQPEIFPDYKDVTVPSNIAPLNFMVDGVDRIQAVVYVAGEEVLKTVGKDGVISFTQKKWNTILEQSKGSQVQVQVSIWTDEFPEGLQYIPFAINVSNDDIDPWLAYRLIEPGYSSWRQLGVYQRNLSTFDESAIVTNVTDNETCLNCHHFPSYSSESMMFHARGKNGGTILYHNGKLTKINFKEIGTKKNTTYPAWHPDGRLLAFSSNSTKQVFYLHGKKPIEVYDLSSDLVIYDTQTGEVLTDPRFMTEETMETFPAWSPDGKWLYYVAADAKSLPDELEQMHYHLLRISFDPETRTFGETIDTLYNAQVKGGSASYPRVSPDGRYLLYTWSQYGTFPIWHEEADLRMMDLETMADVDVALWNDADETDSYHSWSSNGRWTVFGSRRLDGRYTRLYIAGFDENGQPLKPFLLPQEDPRQNLWRLKSYNVPEFIDAKVSLPKDVAELFTPEKR